MSDGPFYGNTGFEHKAEVIKHYDLLDKLGVFQEIDRLKTQLIEKNDLLGEASVIFSQTEIPEIARISAGFLLNKFVPRRLSFLYSSDGGPEVKVLSFRNLHEDPPEIMLIDMEPFEDVFTENVGLVRFSELKERLHNQVALDDLLLMDPELIIPVKGYSGLYGLVIISAKLVGGDYAIAELAYVDRLMSFASIAMQNSIHYSGPVTDAKTSLFNTAFLQSEVEEQMSRVRRYGGKFSLLMIDLDFFKKTNDTYGHLAGDLILKEVAAMIVQSTREGDVAARFGGEEFMVMLHKADSCEAYTIAERLRESIGNRQFRFQGHEIRVTVSIGCASFFTGRDITREELFHLADTALYRSKQGGRNTTSVAGSGLLCRAISRQKLLE